MNLMNLTIPALKNAYKNGNLTPGKLTETLYERALKAPGEIWIRLLSPAEIRLYTVRLDGVDPESLPLYGIPFAIKDNIDLEGIPTTAGCPAYSYTPDRSATVVEKLIRAGAFPVGKTNMDQFATGLVGTRSPYGACKNAFDERYVSGGSSSGSAVAVALGLATFALGTDTAGSGRVPAAFNNIVGIKPTKGLLSARGVVPACRTLDSVSIFSLNTADGNMVFDAARGFDRSDPGSRNNETPRKRPEKGGFVFGVPRRSQLEFFGNAVYEEAFEKSLRRIESCGGRRTEVDFSPFLSAARLLYEGPWVAERYAAVGGFIENAAPDHILPVIKSIIGGGKDLKAHEAFQSMYSLMALKQAADEVMDTVDFLVTPTAGTCYTIDAVNDDPVSLNSNLGYYTNYMNLLDYCAVAVPMTLPKPVPFGITLAGPAFSDETLMGFASMLHNAAGIPMGKTADFPETIGGNCSPPPERPVKLAVCGAHLKGLELHHQLVTADAVFLEKTTTAPCYTMFALEMSKPFKPGLLRDTTKGTRIEVEVYQLSFEAFGTFVAAIPHPLGIGKLELADGTWVPGFIAEPVVRETGKDITEFGSWRHYLSSQS